MFTYKIDQELDLKLLGLEDAEELFELSERSREHLKVWLPWINHTHSVDDTRKYIKFCLKRYSEQNGLTVCILFKGKIAGVIDLHEMDLKNRKTSIGYWMSSEYKGRGLLTRSCRTLFTYVFEDLKLNRIEIRAAEDNIKSWAIPERLGFTKEGTIREAAILYEKPMNHVVYGMLARDWEGAMNK